MDTMNAIDENSKKILFKNFDQNSVNILESKGPQLID